MGQSVRIEVEGRRWVALRVAHAQEFSAAEELSARGFLGYCPTGAKFRLKGKGRRPSCIVHHPVFTRYIFCGQLAGQVVGRDSRIGVDSVLGDSRGPLLIPPSVIRHINDLELAGEWDATKSWREKSPYAPGSEVVVTDGPFSGFPGTVSALESECRIWVLIQIFGRLTRAQLAPCQIAAA